MRVPSHLIYHFFKLTLTEIKIFFLSLHKKQNEAEKIEIPFNCILKNKRAGGTQYNQIARATEKLMKRVLIFDELLAGKKSIPLEKKKYIHFLRYAEHDSAILQVKQSKEIVDLINECHCRGGYINVNVFSILKLRSWYSARLYLLFCQRLKAGYCSIGIDNLRTILQCQKLYTRQQNFINRCIIDPLREINETTDINAKVDTEKRGHKVVKFYFSIAARTDRGNIREIIEDKTAEKIEKTYPAEFIKYCLQLTKKIHRPEKGTAAGLFLKLLKNNFNKWKIESDKYRQFIINRSKLKPKNNIEYIMTPEKYAALPDFVKSFMKKSGVGAGQVQVDGK